MTKKCQLAIRIGRHVLVCALCVIPCLWLLSFWRAVTVCWGAELTYEVHSMNGKLSFCYLTQPPPLGAGWFVSEPAGFDFVDTLTFHVAYHPESEYRLDISTPYWAILLLVAIAQLLRCIIGRARARCLSPETSDQRTYTQRSHSQG